MNRIALKLATALMRIAYAPIKLRKTRDRISIISRQGDTKSLDILMLEKTFRSNYPQFEIVTLTKMLGQGAAGKLSYAFHILSQMRVIATSKVVIVDGYCIAVSVLSHKEETKFVQMWHALGAVKKFGHQTIGKPSGSDADTAEIMRMHENYDYVLCSGYATAPFFCHGFNVELDRIRFYGLPRIDYLKEPLQDELAEEIERTLGIDKSRKTVLYAPTFRKGRPVRAEELASAVEAAGMNLIIKLHPLDAENLTGEPAAKEKAGRVFRTYDLMKYCDVIVTDYSAIDIEGLALNKPMYFYVYDLDEYSEDPGINIDMQEELRGYVFRDAQELAGRLDGPYDYTVLNSFKERYLSVDGENSTEKLCDFIADIMEEQR